MCISTVDSKTLRPSSRYVLLKKVSQNGLVFFTNYESRKAKEILSNPYVSGVFYWPVQNRSVRFEGKVTTVDEVESKEYFESRPLSSRLSGIVSR
jgi:pyridoxamine-phosphate oxidase